MKLAIPFTLIAMTLSLLHVAAAAGAELPDGIYANFKTNKGEIVVRLFYKRTPMTVGNFVGLAEGAMAWKDQTGKEKKSKYYDGLIFHRVINDFMDRLQPPDLCSAKTIPPCTQCRLSRGGEDESHTVVRRQLVHDI